MKSNFVKDKRYYRDLIKLIFAIIFSILYIPHFLVFLTTKDREIIESDIIAMSKQIHIRLPIPLLLLFYLHNKSFYRSLFYYRIGAIRSAIIGWYRPGDRLFIISKSCRIGKSFNPIHPYGTVINAERIGDNFQCIHLTTLGKIGDSRPIIGNNVKCGANVTIIGKITIGDNVEIGAGSVVTKSFPSNCVIAGVPAKLIHRRPF